MKKRSRSKGPHATGISRKVLFALWDLGSSDLKGIWEALGKLDGVTQGTVWTILSRAALHGLVAKGLSGKTGLITWQLTKGGVRRVRWLERNQSSSKG